jgi:hypothetical protein
MIPQTQSSLSSNDAVVLNLVFDPESSGAFSSALIDPTIPPALPHIPAYLLQTLRSAELAAIQPLNVSSPSSSLIQCALGQLTDLIIANPAYASAYNNRAQALRLLVGDDLYSGAVRRSTLWSDLCQAIVLATPTEKGAKVSTLQGSVLSAAHAQRGHLLWKAAKTCNDDSGPGTRVTKGEEGEEGEEEEGRYLPEPLKGFGKARLEEMASIDFEIAGRYGDQGAQKMAASTNPYARLCGDIVREAMKVEIERNSPLKNHLELL